MIRQRRFVASMEPQINSFGRVLPGLLRLSYDAGPHGLETTVGADLMRRYWILVVLLAVTAGCSGGPGAAADASFDSEKARTALLTALDAWKKGEAKSLAKRQPPIRFEDDDLLSGYRLSEYEIEEPDSPIKSHQDVEVILMMKDRQGKNVRREATYQVGLDPKLSVLRSDR